MDANGASTLFVYGSPVYDLVGTDGQPVSGRYTLTGHFDDPESTECVSGGREGDPSDEAAQLACRTSFVVTKVTPAG